MLGLLIFWAAVIIFISYSIRSITIFEYEKGLKYFDGSFKEILGTGTHWFFRYFTKIIKADIRPKFISIPGQEILSADGITLKVSLAAQYEIKDLNTAINKLGNPYEEALYLVLQLTLREIIGSAKIEDILEQRNSLSQQLAEKSKNKIEELGLTLISVNIKDIMFPGELKKIFAEVSKARHEGLAILEKARGESAALRNMANAAGLIKDNPVLMQLRALYSSGNTLVIGIPAGGTILPIDKQNKKESVDTQI